MLAGVGAQGSDLEIERGADVHVGGGLLRPEEIEAAHRVGREALRGDEMGEGHGIAGGGVDGVERRRTGLAMVDVLDDAGLVDDDAGIGRGHGIGPEAADDADELLAEGQVVGQRAIGAMQEGDALVADGRGCGPLLGLAQEAERERVRPGVVAPGIAARAADQVRHRPVADPAADAAGDGVLGIVGMRRDDQEASGMLAVHPSVSAHRATCGALLRPKNEHQKST